MIFIPYLMSLIEDISGERLVRKKMSSEFISRLVKIVGIVALGIVLGAELGSNFPRIKIRRGIILGGIAGFIASIAATFTF